MADWMLKILSGSHLGAEIQLTIGSYTIGSAPRCDIVLSDCNLQDQHLQLIVDEQTARLNLLVETSDLHLNGTKTSVDDIEQVHLSIDTITVLSIGLLHIALGAADGDWQHLRIPALTTLDNPSDANTHSNRLACDNMLPDSPLDKNVSKTKKNASHRPVLMSGRSIAGLLSLILGSASIASLFLMSEKPIAAIKPLDLTNTIATLDHLLDTSQLQITSDDQGLKRINGYVQTQQDKKRLIKHIRQQFPGTQIRVYATDDIINGTMLILKTQGLKNIQVSVTDKTGVFRLHGDTDNIDLWDQSLKVIKRDIAGVESWKNDVKAMGNHRINSHSDNESLITIKSISVGDIAFVTTEDEKKYFVGSVLTSGYTLSKITADGVYLKRDNHQIHYKLGDQ